MANEKTESTNTERIVKPNLQQIKSAILRYLDEKFESADVVDDYRKVVVEGLQASYTNKEELRADVERIFEEGEGFFSDET